MILRKACVAAIFRTKKQYVTEKFIEKPYANRKRLRNKYTSYPDFFKMFVEVTEEGKGVISVEDLFAFVKTNINENTGEDRFALL